jgi:hypothetical protein
VPESTGAVPEGIANACSLRIRPALGPGQQDLRSAEVAKSVLGGDHARGHVPDDLGDLCPGLGCYVGEGNDSLAEPGEGLVQHPRLPVSAIGAGQRGACFRAPLPGERADLLAEAGGRGGQDRGQRGAGGLAGLDGVVPVDHQQPQGFPVPIGAHLRRYWAGQQFAGRPDGVDRVALARPALPDVAAAVDLRHVLALGGEVAGQAQPIVPGALDRPGHRAPPGG